MTIFITGGDGRIGRVLVKELLKRGEKIRIFTCTNRKIRTRKNLEVFYGNILDKNSLENAIDGVDIIYHLAAILDYDASKNIMRKVNVEGTKNLLDVANDRKVIFMSSTAVMGKRLQKIPADEKTYCKPTNIYGQTKYDAEKLVLDKNGIVIRAPPVYGKGFEEGYFDIFDMIMKRKMYIIGNGKNRIQFIHIDDLVNALILVKDKGKPGEIYIVAGDDVLSQEDLIKLSAKKLGVRFKKRYMPLDVARFLARIKSIQNRFKGKKSRSLMEYIDVLAYDRVFNISKARKELGFNPRVKYEVGIDEVVREYKRKRGLL